MIENDTNRILIMPTTDSPSQDRFPAKTGRENRLALDPNKAQSGLASLVLTLVELIRQLLEREAVRRLERGTLSMDEVEQLGTAFLQLQEKIAELREVFGLSEEDLNIDLGPLGRVL